MSKKKKPTRTDVFTTIRTNNCIPNICTTIVFEKYSQYWEKYSEYVANITVRQNVRLGMQCLDDLGKLDFLMMTTMTSKTLCLCIVLFCILHDLIIITKRPFMYRHLLSIICKLYRKTNGNLEKKIYLKVPPGKKSAFLRGNAYENRKCLPSKK